MTVEVKMKFIRVSSFPVSLFFGLIAFLLVGCSEGEVTDEPINIFSLTIASDQTRPGVGPHLMVEDSMLAVGESNIFSDPASWIINRTDGDSFSIANLAVSGVLSVVEEGSFSNLDFAPAGDSEAQRWNFMPVEAGVCLVYSELTGSEVVLTAVREENQNTVQMQNYDPDNPNQNWRFTSIGFDDIARPCP